MEVVEKLMCRSIKVLRRPDEFATQEEIDGAALQFVRKISGFQKPSMANQVAFQQAVAEIATASHRLLESIAAKPSRSSSALRPAAKPVASATDSERV
jgi:hypothetical protein